MFNFVNKLVKVAVEEVVEQAVGKPIAVTMKVVDCLSKDDIVGKQQKLRGDDE